MAVVAIAGGYYYYTTTTSTSSTTTSSATTTSSVAPTSTTSSAQATTSSAQTTTSTTCTAICTSYCGTATCTTYSIPACYTSISSSETPPWQSGSAPSPAVKFDVWDFRPDLVQIGVTRYESQMNENVTLSVITANYCATLETKLLASDVDVAYDTPCGAQSHYSDGLTQVLGCITADFPEGRVLWSASCEVAAINAGYPSFVDAMTSLDGNLIALPYYQSALGTPLVNNMFMQTAGLATSATDSTNWPNSYTDMYNQMPTIVKTGASCTPIIPLWYEAYPGFGLPQGFVGEAGARFGYNNELFSPKPAFTPLFDTNTGVADMLTDWTNLWTNNYAPHDLLTTSSCSDIDGLFETGTFAYTIWWQYNLKVYNNPSVDKFAGWVSPVPNGTGSTGNNWGYTIQQVYLMRNMGSATADLRERANALIVWMTWKDRTNYPYEPLRIAAQADIAAFTAYVDVNTGPEVLNGFQSSLPDPTTQLPQTVAVQQDSTYNQIIPASWATDWMVDLSEQVPNYLTGEQSQATTITNLRNSAEQLIAAASSSS